jgi:hypothetical protein
MVVARFNVSAWMDLDDLTYVLGQLLCDDSYHGPGPCDVSKVLAQYGDCEPYRSIDACANYILRDFIFLCSSRRASSAHVLASQVGVWQYQFNYESTWKVHTPSQACGMVESQIMPGLFKGRQ